MLTFTAGERFIEIYFDVDRLWFSHFKLERQGEFTRDALAPLLEKHWS